MLASIGASAKQGLLIKGGKYLELLARADILLLDKTGTIMLGKPKITHIFSLNGMPEAEILRLSAIPNIPWPKRCARLLWIKK